ncbi:helix-turn-helix transcriptional regulator [bacterium]|nr:helix-turn-helix transcriptional regulator [bacterium]
MAICTTAVWKRPKQLLTAGEMTVAEAASAVGYANRSHFALAFRQQFGLNPSTYRRSKRMLD